MLNAIWYACEGKTKEALTSALCALPGLGMGIGSLMEKTSKFAQAGKTVKYLSRMAQGGMGVVAGISMAKTGFTNILNGLESGNLSGWDVVTFIGGIAITGLSGRNLAISGRGLAGMMDDAGKVAKAGKGQNAGNVDSQGLNKGIHGKSSSNCTELAPYYPSNGGAISGTESVIYLMPGDKIDRFGKLEGKYFSPIGTPVEMRALPYNADLSCYEQFEVIKPFEVKVSTIAPAFNKIGLGIQYQSPVSADILLKRGIIKRMGNNL